MKIFNRHERLIAAPPDLIAALVADFAVIWPAQLAPVPRPRGDRRYDTTVEGTAIGAYEQLWPERIEPLHNRMLEALLDNVKSAT